jgi:A1 cistron-splicing factor AAR2
MITNPEPPNSQTSLKNNPNSHMAAKDPNLWHHLTSCMKGALLSAITGHEWNQWQVSSTDDYKPISRINGHPDDTRTLHKSGDKVLKFMFPKSTRTFSSNSIGADRTEQAMDTSTHILGVITSNCTYEDSDEIIGELQFCYITGMVLGNLACMEHWAHIVKVCKFPKFQLRGGNLLVPGCAFLCPILFQIF